MRTKACGFAILHLAVEPMEQCIFLKENTALSFKLKIKA